MKLLYCEDCGDVVNHSLRLFDVRSCRCGRHSIWPIEPGGVRVLVYDRTSRGVPKVPRAFIVMIANSFLQYTDDVSGPSEVASIMAEMQDISPDHALTQAQSFILKMRPSNHPRAGWSANPPGVQVGTVGQNPSP